MSAAGNILAQAATPPPGADALIGPYVGVFVVAFVVSLLLTPVLRRLARYFGVVDQPGARKLHREPVPYLGGVAIFLGWLAGMASCLFVAPTHSEHVGVGVAALPLSVIFGAAVITLVGLVDDVYGVSPRVKLGGQLLAAAALANDNLGLILVQSTLSALGISHPSFYFCYIAGAALIALLVLGGCNAMNLMDGLDGLAAGVAAIAQVGFLAIAVTAVLSVHRDPDLAGSDPLADVTRIVLCLATLGAVLGFLPYNFNPASIFMGDAGSLLLGYLSMSAILLFAQAATKAPGFFAAGLIVFSLPIIDTILAIVRRRLRGVAISTADKQHIHHLLLARWERLGVGPQMRVKLTAFWLYALAALLAVSGYIVAQLRVRYALGVTLVYFAFVVVTAYKSGQRIVAAERQAALTPAAPAAPAAAQTPPAPSPTSKAS